MNKVWWLGKSDLRYEKYLWAKENQAKLLKVLDTQYDEEINKHILALKWDMNFDRYTDSMKKVTALYMREFRLLFG